MKARFRFLQGGHLQKRQRGEVKLGASMNWTTTRVPLWQSDCENFRRALQPFEVRDVVTAEQWQFIEDFATRYELTIRKHGFVAVLDRG
jgi:hypothetical protein